MTEYLGYVYRVTNEINQKTYVGQRRLSRDTAWDDYYGSGDLVIKAIAKYGRSNFKKELVAYAKTQDELDRLETNAIVSEWEKGRGEYNQRAFVPSPDSWTRLPESRLFEIKRRLSTKSTPRSEEISSQNKQRAENSYRQFLANTELDELIRVYTESGNLKDSAAAMGVSAKHARRFLHDKGMLAPPRTTKGAKRSASEKESISRSLQIKAHGDFAANALVLSLA